MKKTNRKNVRGLGTLELRGDTWHVDFMVHGKRYRETSGTEKYKEAVQFLKTRISEVEQGKFNGPRIERILMSELLQDVLDDYKMYHPKSYTCFALSLIKNHLLPFFGDTRATQMSTARIRSYIAERKEAKAADATVNRELALLRRAFNLGERQTPPKVLVKPSFKGLLFRENNARQGFFEYPQFVALRDALPVDDRAVFVAGYYTLMRYSALVNMPWDWVDLEASAIRIPPGYIKNKEPLMIPTGGPGCEFHDLLTERKALRDASFPECPWIFYRSSKHKGSTPGRRLVTIRYAMDAACEALGMTGKLFHDLRRTGARDMRKAGVSEGVVMKLGAWKTASVFRRYDIKDETDLHAAAAARNSALAEKTKG